MIEPMHGLSKVRGEEIEMYSPSKYPEVQAEVLY